MHVRGHSPTIVWATLTLWMRRARLSLIASACVLDVALAQEVVDGGGSPTTRDEAADSLPQNPELTTPIPGVADAVDDQQVLSALTDDAPTRVRVGLHGGVASRPSAAVEAEYAPGVTWGGYASAVFLPWLSLRFHTLVGGHSVTVSDGAWGLSQVRAPTPALRTLSLRGEVELRRFVAQRLAVWGAVGFGWTRMSMGTFTLREPFPASMEMRSGSVLEVPLGAGVGYQLWGDHLMLTLDFRVAPAVSQTGELFQPQEGQGETVRQDTGDRITLDGLPEVRTSTLALLGLELSF